MRRQGAGAQRALLPAAEKQRLDARNTLAIDAQGPRALRSVHLVRRKRQQVDTLPAHIQGKLAGALRRVDVQPGAMFRAKPAEFGNVLNDADFVVHVHQRHEHGVGPQRGTECLTGHHPPRIGFEASHLETFVPQGQAGFESCRMFAQAGDDVAPLPRSIAGRADHPQSDGLGRARGEDDLLARQPHQGADLRRRFGDQLSGLDPALVPGGRVGVRPGQEQRAHALGHARIHRRGSGVVHVDRRGGRHQAYRFNTAG